jgi:hypothetical protein
MPLKTLVVIALRLYAMYWLVEGLSTSVIYFPTFWEFMLKVSPDGISALYSFFVIPPSMLAFAAILWAFSSRLSSQVTKGHDTELAFTSLSKEDLYRFAFVFLGLFFALSSIYSIVQTGYQFFAFGFPLPDNNPGKGRYLWPFLGHTFTLIAGFGCVFGARIWTNKLIRLENKHEAPPPAV